MKNKIDGLLAHIEMMGMTQKKFCEDVKILINTVNSISQKGDFPSADMFKLIAENLQAHSISWLLTEKGEPACSSSQHSSNNSGIGIIGNNVNGGSINDNQFPKEMMQLLKKKDEQIDKLLEIMLENKQLNKY
jgi:transcriptional regulator with XRE-family HTH domain